MTKQQKGENNLNGRDHVFTLLLSCIYTHLNITHLHIEVFAHSVDSDPMKTSICQIFRGRTEHIRTSVCLKMIPDLEAS